MMSIFIHSEFYYSFTNVAQKYVKGVAVEANMITVSLLQSADVFVLSQILWNNGEVGSTIKMK